MDEKNYKDTSVQKQSGCVIAKLVVLFLIIHSVFAAIDGLREGISYLSNLGSRVSGYPGSEKAAEYILSKFKEIGLEHVGYSTFTVVVPIDRGASLSDGRNTYKLYSLWPNLVRTPSVPKDGIRGKIIYASRSRLEDYNDKDVEGSIVLLDFDCGSEWLNAFMLGARAVIFIEPEIAIRKEAELKFLSLPVNAPRYWISKLDARRLMDGIRKSPDKIYTLKADMTWEEVTTKNIHGIVLGKDEKLRKEMVVISAYYDSMSIVPALSPGAEQSCSVVALFELAKQIRQKPTGRSVMFLATGGHCFALQGIKHFADTVGRHGFRIETVRRVVPKKEGVPKEEFTLCLRARYTGATPHAFVYLVYNEGHFTIPEKAFLEYEVYIPSGSVSFRGGVDLTGGSLRSLRGTAAIPEPRGPWQDLTKAMNNWLHRKIDLAPVAGKTFYRAVLAVDDRDRKKGGYIAYFKNIRITDASGKVLIDLYTNKPTVPVKPYLDPLGPPPRGVKSMADYRITVEKAPVAPEIDIARKVETLRTQFFIGLDLSSNNSAVGIFHKGSFYDHSDADIHPKYVEFGKVVNDYAINVATITLGFEDAREIFVNAINPIKGRIWKSYLPDLFAFESEVMALYGIPAITFATVNDSRSTVDTPLDKHVNYDNLATQIRFLEHLIPWMIDLEDVKKIRLGHNDCVLGGRVVEFDLRVSYIPDSPIPDAIVVARGRGKTFTGVRGELMDITDSSGIFRFTGIGFVRVVPSPAMQKVEAYLLDKSPENYGEIIYAPDLGEYGDKMYPQSIPMNLRHKETTIVVFPCRSLTVFDVIDQRFYRVFRGLQVYDARLDTEPHVFGRTLARAETIVNEPVAVIFMKPGEIGKVTMSSGLTGIQLALINVDPENPMGKGYKLDKNQVITLTPYRAAKDMWLLNDWRMEIMRRHGIENDRLDRLHNLSKQDLIKAERYLNEKKYDKAIRYARSAWGYESRAYPDVRKTGNDVVRGVVFYLALLLPFAYFLERLLFAFPDINKQVGATFIIFLIVFVLIRYAHPAFDIALTPLMILLAFIILALALIVIVIVLGKFDEQFKEYKKRVSGVHTTDIGRLSATAVAFALGASNMRKRKGRTLLTCITLILLTFTLLSFTSVKTFLRESKMSLGKKALYTGILIRDRNWEPLEETTYKIVRDEFADQDVVSPISWYYSTMVGNQSFVDVQHGKNFYSVTSLLGLTSTDPLYHTNPGILLRGRWFDEDDTFCCILPSEVAQKLKADVGSTVRILGLDLQVIGILDDQIFKDTVNLDDEEFTPVNYLAMAERMVPRVEAAEAERTLPQRFIHLLPHGVAILPYSTVMRLGGTLRAINIRCKDASRTKEILDRLLPRLAIDLFAGLKNERTGELESHFCGSVGLTTFGGLGNLLIPVIIAAFIVFNTMLGSVYERVKEIGIYSSLGLAPSHVAMLFLAEACVYAVVGGVSGYLVGQGISKLVTAFDLLPGLTLNYSSLSAVGTIFLIMVVVILSTIYPAMKASRMAAPAVERKWEIGEPVGDDWSFELPFTVSKEEVKGLNMFLKEFFEGHQEYSIGDFYAESGEIKEEKGGYALQHMTWLTPFDLGVSQKVYIITEPIEENVYKITLKLHRESGDVSSWKRTNQRFINILRKQFLLWRTLQHEKREEYQRRFQIT